MQHVGHSVIIGVDEAGRGALAGPVVAAAVVLHSGSVPDGVADSKSLTARKRAGVAEAIKQHCVAYAVAFVDHERIAHVNIAQATFDAMHQAIDRVVAILGERHISADLLRIDGNRFREHAIPHQCLVGGDATDASIAAASILAKTSRDAWMVEVAHRSHPEYHFDQHKGYGTQLHRHALLQYGVSPLHRRNFVATFLKTNE